jgi:hypothetical protein
VEEKGGTRQQYKGTPTKLFIKLIKRENVNKTPRLQQSLQKKQNDHHNKTNILKALPVQNLMI